MKRTGKKRKEDIRPNSIPSTIFSATFLSTVFAASLTVSVAALRDWKVVEKARGVMAMVREKRGAVRVRKDILDVVWISICV